jgi:hypothetical protein
MYLNLLCNYSSCRMNVMENGSHAWDRADAR